MSKDERKLGRNAYEQGRQDFKNKIIKNPYANRNQQRDWDEGWRNEKLAKEDRELLFGKDS